MMRSFVLEMFFVPFGGCLQDYRVKPLMIDNSSQNISIVSDELVVSRVHAQQKEVNNVATIVYTFHVKTSLKEREVREILLEKIRENCLTLGIFVLDSLDDVDVTIFKDYSLLWTKNTNVVREKDLVS